HARGRVLPAAAVARSGIRALAVGHRSRHVCARSGMALGERQRPRPLVALEMAIGASWSLPESVIRHLLLTQLPGYLAHFAAGMAIALAWLRRRDRRIGEVASLAWLAGLFAAFGLLYWLFALGAGERLGAEGSWL